MLIMNEGQNGHNVDEIGWLILATNYKEQEDGDSPLVSLRKNLGQEFAKLPKLSELVIHLILKIFSAIVDVIEMKIAVAMVKREISP